MAHCNTDKNLDPRIRKATTLLEGCRTNLKIADVAHDCNLSLWHFSHLFTKQKQASPLQFYRAIKFNKAKDLLENSFLSIKQIMREIGINDKSHFSRDFKKIYGLSPKEYRRQHPPV